MPKDRQRYIGQYVSTCLSTQFSFTQCSKFCNAGCVQGACVQAVQEKTPVKVGYLPIQTDRVKNLVWNKITVLCTPHRLTRHAWIQTSVCIHGRVMCAEIWQSGFYWPATPGLLNWGSLPGTVIVSPIPDFSLCMTSVTELINRWYI